PEAQQSLHAECGCLPAALWMASNGDIPSDRTQLVALGGRLEQACHSTADRVLVATEVGMLHQLRQANPNTDFQPVNPKAACRYMKMITPANLLTALRDGVDEVTVEEEVAAKARQAVERMVAIGTPDRGE